MTKMPRTTVRPHTRNGRPVRGYTQNRTFSQHIGSILAGDQKGSVGLALFGAGIVAAGTVLWYGLSFTLTGAEAVIVATGIMCAIFGIGSAVRHRRRHPTKYNKITFSPRKRMHHLKAKIRKNMPAARYRRSVQRYRKRHPIQTGIYDRWFAKYEITAVSGKGKQRKAHSTFVRGVANRDTFLGQAKEKQRQQKMRKPDAPTWNFTSRQVFR